MSRPRPRWREWVIEPGGPCTIEAVLEAMGDRGALREGRVALGGRRVDSFHVPLSAGDRVVVWAERHVVSQPTVLLEQGGFVVADKPPELPTEPDRSGKNASLKHLVARELGLPEARLHAVSRLDVGVSGAVLFAVTRRSRQRGALGHFRSYLAIGGLGAAGSLGPRGLWSSPVAGRQAITRFTVVARSIELSIPPFRPALMVLVPETGRTHQLRIHAARAGAPLLGDRAHGGPRRLVLPDGRVVEASRVALHALRVVVPDGPEVIAPVPADLRELWKTLGGAEPDWQKAERVARGADP